MKQINLRLSKNCSITKNRLGVLVSTEGNLTIPKGVSKIQLPCDLIDSSLSPVELNSWKASSLAFSKGMVVMGAQHQGANVVAVVYADKDLSFLKGEALLEGGELSASHFGQFEDSGTFRGRVF